MNDQRPHVLLLGDSIRISYQPLVAEQLQTVATVTGPAENCQFSLYTLSALPRWLKEYGPPTVVHWNNGLHDVGHNPRREPVQIPLPMYLANLDYIRQVLAATGARIIWATSTPIDQRCAFAPGDWLWRNEEIDRYNQSARALMKQHNIPINDLHAVVRAAPDRYLGEDGIHLSPAGMTACARAVARVVREILAR